MNRPRATLAVIGGALAGLALVSGGSGADPRTPPALPGLPPPFLGTTVLGGGELTAALDAYGDVVDLRPSPAGPGLIDLPSERQAAGTVPVETGIVPRVRIGSGPALPLWRADSVRQHHLPGTNVVITTARFGRVRATLTSAATGGALVLAARTWAPMRGGDGSGERTAVLVSFDVNLLGGRRSWCRGSGGESATLLCGPSAGPGSGRSAGAIAIAAARLLRRAAAEDRRWLASARPLGPGAPGWARRLYERSLLTLRGLTDARTGALAAGARDGWAYVWPRDAATAVLALAASGCPVEARRVARFLRGLDLGAAARFNGDGDPVPGRGAQGDAAGWVDVASQAAGLRWGSATGDNRAGLQASDPPIPWRNRPDYQEGASGNYLGNAIASAPNPVDGPETYVYRGKSAHRREGLAIARTFAGAGGLVRRAGDPGSGLDSAAAWAVRPFAQPALFPAARETLVRLLAGGTRFGITPGEGWNGEDPWTAPTAWSAWSFAALARHEARTSSGQGGPARRDRRRALRLLADLRRAATPAGELPERVDANSGVPRSTTPLAWSHAFAVLALRELWPGI